MIWQTTATKSQSSEAKEAEAAHAVRFAGEIFQSRQTRDTREKKEEGIKDRQRGPAGATHRWGFAAEWKHMSIRIVVNGLFRQLTHNVGYQLLRQDERGKKTNCVSARQCNQIYGFRSWWISTSEVKKWKPGRQIGESTYPHTQHPNFFGMWNSY
jgi:hypothetical protein